MRTSRNAGGSRATAALDAPEALALAYDRARNVVRELVPLLHTIREQDRSLAEQLKRAAQSVVLNIAEARGNDAGNARARFSTACGSAKEVRAALNVTSDWGYIEGHTATRLDEKLDEVCAITWCLGRRR